MADKEDSQPQPKKMPVKLLAIVAVLMLLEAGAVYLVVTMTGASDSAAAVGVDGQEESDRERLIEIQLVEDRFQNMSTGRVWQWKVELVLRVRKKNEDRVLAEMERRAAEIREGVATILRRAQDRHLREPGLETIGRQFTTYTNEVFGHDPAGVPRVDDVIIAQWMGSPMDY